LLLLLPCCCCQPSNVLVMGEGPEAGVVKVADFGLARFFQAREVKFTMISSIHQRMMLLRPEPV